MSDLASPDTPVGTLSNDVRSFDGTRLALRTWGPPDAPVVVLVHGLGLSTGSWGDVPESLADRHRVVGYDLRGHADSGDARSGGYDLEAHARDLAAVLGACLPAGRRAVVAGHSLGGGIILAAAALAGTGRIAGVVFAGSGGSGVTAPGLPARGLPRPVQDALQEGWFRVLRTTALIGRRLRPVQAVSDRLVRRAAFTDDAPEDAVARVRDSFLTTRPLALAGTTLASVSHDGTELAPHLDVPTLVLHGEDDPEVPPDDLRELMAALPDGEVVQLPGAGHMLPLLHPDVVAEHIARWVTRTRG
ncbi:alpha/beta fold hydrolase [Geodermatophilus sp. DSM 44513]|uniref:alpha/beta fold hydrolase n=1 Tax=Geodermatophilus sp. DSM 44513 TaxID=1528104 RepID=UPI001289CDEF|nr:alpha/beta hydrolase [Geodermatophilus sp. DSM 44513]WNV77652.1 alpha/beta hydrolase [Geodermatophilus sp. DSM 44513]